MSGAFDHELLFQQVTGRDMRKEDADELRRLRVHMPSALADSPSYNFDLIVKYHQSQQLREIVSTASDVIIGDVERQSRKAVARLVDESVERIHAAAPSSTAAFYRAFVAACIVILLSSILSAAGVFGVISAGTIAPPWLSRSDAGKVEWANAVESRIGRRSIDWTMRNGKPDPALIEILRYLEARGTEADPVRKLADVEDCRAPGEIAYRSEGRTICRFEVLRRSSQVRRDH